MTDKSCLFISHRDHGDSPPGQVAHKVFDNVIVPSVRSFKQFTTIGSHQHEMETGSISTSIVDDVLAADLVIFDLSELSSDGYYLAGARHAAGLPTVFISEAEYVISFDFRDFGHVRYSKHMYEGPPKLELTLVEAIRLALETTPRPPGLGLPQKRLSPVEMRSELAVRVQEAADAVRLLRVNSAADIVADLEKVARDLEAVEDERIPSVIKESGEKVLQILLRIADQLGSVKGSRVVIAGIIAVVLGGTGLSALPIYGLTLAFWQGPEMFAKAIDALTKRKK